MTCNYKPGISGKYSESCFASFTLKFSVFLSDTFSYPYYCFRDLRDDLKLSEESDDEQKVEPIHSSNITVGRYEEVYN